MGRILNGVIQQIDDGLTKNQPVYGDDEVCVTLEVCCCFSPAKTSTTELASFASRTRGLSSR